MIMFVRTGRAVLLLSFALILVNTKMIRSPDEEPLLTEWRGLLSSRVQRDLDSEEKVRAHRDRWRKIED